MRHIPMKPAVLALILLVITLCLTVMAVLTISTAQADMRLAERYGEMTARQYARECSAQRFLQQADAHLRSGGSLDELDGVTACDGIYTKTVADDNAVLVIELRLTDDGGYEVIGWRTEPQRNGAA